MKPIIKFRKDYLPPTHCVESVDLYIELEDNITTITSQMKMKKNLTFCHSRVGGNPENNLILDGQDLVLKSIKLNDQSLTSNQYRLDKESLTLLNVPEEFKLEIVTAIKPQENTVLMGLYQSQGIYCTQCESEGFRRITYFLDHPDVLTKFTVSISADKKRYPVLLSNGNLTDSGDLSGGRHWMRWADPFLKPCYLFAMVAGKLDYIEDYFTTCSGREITCRIFSLKDKQAKCQFAMRALKQAMQWDEEQYGREYDLDLFMIFVVDDFNVGAMENKGLNIFNTKCLLVNSETATDAEYDHVAEVVAHEYFHNWTGNRVTCRDWFQLSLKEGLTVFRDQCFSEETTSKAVARIQQVQRLRDLQFPEDAGPLAHPVRPDSYVEIDNFYTMTVYEKGAEIIRMMRNILGKQGFRRGMDLYFERHDGQAVTCDDFVKAMEDANQVDFKQFRLWYSQAGTPELYLTDIYDEKLKKYKLTVKQRCPATPKQPDKKPMHIPLLMALLDKSGKEMSVKLADKENTHWMLSVTKEAQEFIFENVDEKPIPSLLRDFSAPVKCFYDYHDEALAFLMAHDRDAFARWEASQYYMVRVIKTLMASIYQSKELTLPEPFIAAFEAILNNPALDQALKAQMLCLPTELYLSELESVIDIDVIFTAREFMLKTLAKKLHESFLQVYQSLNDSKPYEYTVPDVAKRSLKNTCLHYLMQCSETQNLGVTQFEKADNMTDRFTALSELTHIDSKERTAALKQFYHDYQKDPLVVDKWFSVQALSKLPNTLSSVTELLNHKAFNIKNPNRVRALLGTFSTLNPIRFHEISGKGYQLLTDQILQLDKINPHIAARILTPLTRWKRYNNVRKQLMYDALKQIEQTPNISKNIYEIVAKSLDDSHEEKKST